MILRPAASLQGGEGGQEQGRHRRRRRVGVQRAQDEAGQPQGSFRRGGFGETATVSSPKLQDTSLPGRPSIPRYLS